MAKVSVIIPARNEKWLEKTVDDIFLKATGEIEVIVILDGYWPDPILVDRPNLILLHRGEAQGMREGINSAARIASGQYLMKTDAHCLFAEGFDEALKKDMEDNWVSIPTRYSLDAEDWARGYGPLEYLFLTFPYNPDRQFGEGLHGKKWCGQEGNNPSSRPNNYYWMERAKAETKIDDIQAFQGSCWFMAKQRFFDIGGLDGRFGTFFQEPQEIGFKIWMSGGRMVINKNTWYAHWHKSEASGYGFSNRRKKEAFRYSTWYWMNDQWPLATRKMEEFIKFHWPIPGWPEDWREMKVKFESENLHNYAIPPLL